MLIRSLGASGSVSTQHDTTSFLVNERLAIDAGSLCRYLSVDDQSKIDSIFITHSHLDHIAHLGFLADNVVSTRTTPVKVFGSPEVRRHLKQYLLNDVLWPDFTRIQNNGQTPVLELIELMKPVTFDDLNIIPFPVNHAPGSLGYIVASPGAAWIFTGDGGPDPSMWQIIKSLLPTQVSGIVVDVSFPNRLEDLATRSRHFTPTMISREIRHIPGECPIWVQHIKPQFRREVIQELHTLREPRIKIMEEGQILSYR